MKKAVYFFFIVFAIAVLTAVSGCGGPKPPAPKGNIIATVNGNAIADQDLKMELALRAEQDPSFKITPQTLREQLDLMVNRKLLVQEAIDRKLTEQDRFKASIRTFWEQTLIRVLMDKLSKEFEQTSFATEKEIQDYYGKLNVKATFEIMRSKNKALMEKALELALKGEPLSWDEKAGPVTYDELNSEVLEEAWDLDAGKFKIDEKDGVHYLVHMAVKEAVTPPSLEAIRGKIKNKIKLRKQRTAFDKWLKEKRQKADIKINDLSQASAK